ncbi:hypothetical protein M9Y10_005254 [Tritrichomonas musculus]|uniref:Uncharacterized protein n=1 Tax=Tritrichomonas musculus TaxID=1915356 RepID=A0ABR2JKP5_9EUKA
MKSLRSLKKMFSNMTFYAKYGIEVDLLIPQLIFQLKHNKDGAELIDKLKEKLPDYVSDPNLMNLDYEILLKIVNLKSLQDDNDNFEKVFNFCLNYLDEHRNDKNCSGLFATLNVSKISVDNQRELESRPYFDRSVLKDSLGKALTNIDLSLKEIIDYITEKKARRAERLEDNNDINIANPPLFYPDFAAMTNKGWNNTTVTSEFWVFAYAATNGHTAPSTVRVCNKKNFCVAGNNSYYGASSITIPIKRSQSITFTANTSQSQQAFFAPFKTNNEVVGLPNYSEAKPKVWNNKNFAECNGWIYACSGANGDKAYITLNDSNSLYFSYHGNSYNSFGSILIPISRGDSYLAYHSYNPHSLLFIPAKENEQTGFPDYNKESPLAWGEQFTANESGWIYVQCMSISCNSNNPQYSPGNLTVNGTNFVISQIYAGNQMLSSLFMPISKGDKCCANGGNSNQMIYFYPFIKEG